MKTATQKHNISSSCCLMAHFKFKTNLINCQNIMRLFSSVVRSGVAGSTAPTDVRVTISPFPAESREDGEGYIATFLTLVSDNTNDQTIDACIYEDYPL